MKKIYISALFGFLFSTLIAQTSMDTGLVRNYPFNGNANDASSNLSHGTVYGATLTTDRFGNTNSAYSFNGSTDYINIPYDYPNCGLLLSEYTYSIWALAQSIPTLGTETNILFIGDGYTPVNFPQTTGQAITASNTTSTFHNGWGGYGHYSFFGSNYSTYSNASIIINTWKHIVLTRSANSMKLYINNVLISFDSTIQATYPEYGYVDPMLLNILVAQLI